MEDREAPSWRNGGAIIIRGTWKRLTAMIDEIDRGRVGGWLNQIFQKLVRASSARERAPASHKRLLQSRN